jgi:hypothetical protein
MLDLLSVVWCGESAGAADQLTRPRFRPVLGMGI